MKLKIELFRYKTVVFGSVLHQDKSLRAERVTLVTLGISKDGKFKIKSLGRPELTSDVLFVRGSDTAEDDTAFRFAYESECKAMQACRYIQEIVDIINGEPKEEDTSSIERVM